MGSWGAGLYSNDIALDLKSAVAAIVKLPFESEQLIKMLAEAFPEEASNEANEDYTTFWLVLADQFHKRGIDCRMCFLDRLKLSIPIPICRCRNRWGWMRKS